MPRTVTTPITVPGSGLTTTTRTAPRRSHQSKIDHGPHHCLGRGSRRARGWRARRLSRCTWPVTQRAEAEWSACVAPYAGSLAPWRKARAAIGVERGKRCSCRVCGRRQAFTYSHKIVVTILPDDLAQKGMRPSESNPLPFDAPLDPGAELSPRPRQYTPQSKQPPRRDGAQHVATAPESGRPPSVDASSVM